MGRSLPQRTAGAGRAAAGRPAQRRDQTHRAIRDAAVSMFSEHGYHAVTLRNLATRIGIQAGSLYNHIENKQDLLFAILRETMNDLVQSYDANVAPVGGTLARLDAFVHNHVAFHTARKEEVFIGTMELRNLSADNHAAIVGLRRAYQAHLIEILERGRAEGLFGMRDARLLAFAILGMLNAIPTWFNPAGPRSAEDIAEHYVHLVHALVAPEPGRDGMDD